jgi:glycosyltransferase involved in cell wall biosynthesis
MKKVILITSSFPYYGGEQFLETEVEYYCQHKDVNLTIAPISKTKEERRKVPDCIDVEDFLANRIINERKKKIYYLLKALTSRYFYKELCSEYLFSIKKLKILFSAISTYQMYYKVFDIYLAEYKNLESTMIYTYWDNEATYALQSLIIKYNYKLVSRIHGGDLYKERRPFGYMPLKKHFIKNIDAIYTITQSANDYLTKTYGFDKDVLKLSRLGVNDHDITSSKSKDNCYHIVSCSFLVSVKRVDKTIEALEKLANTREDIYIKWSHIGSGTLEDYLKKKAKELLKKHKKLSYNFLGELKNKEVYEFYKNNDIDVFINVSKSEGVPVSVMEAMSCHIPIIAPNVGGIKDMVIDEYNGVLLSENPDINEIAEGLGRIEYFKNSKTRDNAYALYLDKYNAQKNYTNFIKELKRIC